MDNLTHSLAGAILGQMGLKKKTGLGMATLIIGANIPDLDAFATLLGNFQNLAIRRGLTHGPIAMLLLPIMLTGLMIAYDKWQTRRGKRPADRLPIHKGWLLALAYIGTLSHPLLDWFNTYGIRLLEPFNSTWYAADTLFIIDLWIWIALIAGVWISRRLEKSGSANWRRPAWATFVVLFFYVLGNGAITTDAEARTTLWLENRANIDPDLVVASPVPVKFWQRKMLWRGQGMFGDHRYCLFHRGKEPEQPSAGSYPPTNMDHPLIAKASAVSSALRNYLVWSRMPYAEIEETETEYLVTVRDQRYSIWRAGERFTVWARVPKKRE